MRHPSSGRRRGPGPEGLSARPHQQPLLPDTPARLPSTMSPQGRDAQPQGRGHQAGEADGVRAPARVWALPRGPSQTAVSPGRPMWSPEAARATGFRETPLARSREELGGPRCRQNSAVGGGGCKRGPEAGLGPGLQGPHLPDRQAWTRRLRSSGPPRGRFSDRGTAHDASESPARGPRAMARDSEPRPRPHTAPASVHAT